MGHWNFDDHLAGWNDHFYDQIFKEIQSIRKDILNADLCGEEIQSMVKSISKKLGGS